MTASQIRPVEPRPIDIPICEDCGSPNISASANNSAVMWDVKTQEWQLSDPGTVEEGWCLECEAECDIAWIVQ